MPFLLAAAATAATWTVDPSGRGDFLSVAEGAEAASPGDTLLVEPGAYTDRLILRKDLVIRSTGGRAVTTLRDGWQQSLILVEAGHVVIEGFEITTANDPQHCVRVRDGASVELVDDWIHGCDAGDGLGGGLRTDVGSEAVVRGCLFEDNLAHWTAGAKAAHVYARGDRLEVTDSVFRRGRSEGMGGAMSLMGGDLTIVGNVFEDNVAAKDAGAIEVDGRPTTFPDGTSSRGAQRLVLTDNTIVGNTTDERGGALVLREVEDYEVARNLICGNRSALRGGAVQIIPASPTGRFHHDVIANNTSADQGGAFFVQGGTLVLEHEDLLGNEAVRGGGLVVHDGEVVLRHTLLGWNAPDAVSLDPQSALDADWSAWWRNTPADVDGAGAIGPHAVTADPRLVAFAPGGACAAQDFGRLPDSPLLDAGDPAEPDDDGSPPDLGALGDEPAAPPGTPDGGTTATTGDTGADPGDTGAPAPEDPQRDPDPSPAGPTADTGDRPEAGPPPAGGCGCDTRPGGSPLAALLLLGALRRRRS